LCPTSFFPLSGAGPSILAFYEKGCEPVCDLACRIFAMHGHASEVVWTAIDDKGLVVVEQVE